MNLRFTAVDAERASDEWGCNCGPSALAAITGRSLFYKSGEGAKTVAHTRGFNSGWADERDKYADRYWKEYVAAAKAIIESR
jgi:hypothetical protein